MPKSGAIIRHMKNDIEHRLTLRLTPDLFEAMDAARRDEGGKRSLNSWVAEAISEKVTKVAEEVVVEPVRNGQGHTFFEFFAGGGMARAGLGDGWDCRFANDFSAMKGHVYKRNWRGGSELLIEDVNKVTTEHLPGSPDLVWASFPCQDLSLAGNYVGIGHRDAKEQTRSGTFWPFWRLMRKLMEDGRAPALIVLENVYGALTSHDGKDFAALCSAYSGAGYKFGALVIDAKHFVPQSRQRVFIVGVRSNISLPPEVVSEGPAGPWHPKVLQSAYAGLSKEAQRRWLWWRLPLPDRRQLNFSDLLESNPTSVEWHSEAETSRLLSLMSPVHLKKVEEAKRAKHVKVGCVYKRTRTEGGKKVQRAEVRFDEIAGCLRTPSGGSSRQLILVVEGHKVRSRLLSTREAARLMGLPDNYWLPANYNDAYHVAGDGVAVPVVRYLREHLFDKLLGQATNPLQATIPDTDETDEVAA